MDNDSGAPGARFDERMEPDVVPPDLAAALLDAGYRVGGPVGVGARGPAWSAVGREDGPAAGVRVVVTVLEVPTGPRGDRVRTRLAALRALGHEHLAEVVEIVPIGGSGAAAGGVRERSGVPGRWAVLLAEVPGPTLAALLAARPPLADGEAVTLVVPLAEALAALHDAGLVHGDVSPANVVVRPDGRPVLVDLLGAVTAEAGTGEGLGTPGFAAPEVERGARPVPASDVHALARLALAALAPGSGPGLRVVLDRACAPDPPQRPSAAELAARCYAEAAPQPLDLPDAAVLARTTLARLATPPSPRSALTQRPPGSRHRAEPGRWRTAARGLAAVGALAVCGAVVAGVIAREPTAGAGAGPPAVLVDDVVANEGTSAALRSATPSDPVAAAVSLTERRAAVLAVGDPAGLAQVELVGAGAHAADLEVLARLREAGLRIEGLAAEVVSARLVDSGTADEAARARVEVTSMLTAHHRLSPDGAISAEVPAQPARTVVLTLAWTSAGWRVAEVAEGALSGPAG